MRDDECHLYKYASLSGNDRIIWAYQTIVKRRIFFSSPKQFNDPFDFAALRSVQNIDVNQLLDKAKGWMSSPAVKVVPDMAYDFCRMEFPLEKKLSPVEKIEATQNALNLQGACCFSELGDDILMWSHYADGHRGVCFVFDRSIPPFSDAKKVQYQTKYPISEGKSVDEILRALCLTKSDQWSYEREWRILRGEPGYVQYDEGGLCRVVCGCEISDELFDLIGNWAGSVNVEAKKASSHLSMYAVQIDP